MKIGTAIARAVRPAVNAVDYVFHTDFGNCTGCKQMEQDFNNAEHFRDYSNAVLDRIRKRGKYKKES